MALSYLSGGEPILAEDMNRLFDELDRKASLALDNHSLMYLLGESKDQTRRDFWRYFGQPFIFKSGSQPVSGYWGTWSYDHSVFSSAVASSILVDTPNTYGLKKLDKVRSVATVNPFPESVFSSIGIRKSNPTIQHGIGDDSPSLLRYSLEAHRATFTDPETGEQLPFWVRESFNPLADTSGANAFAVDLCRVKMFHQAEIIIEGRNSQTEFVIPIAWNRFRFFRFHNLDATPLQVRFESLPGTNGSQALEVSPRSSKCVRRVLSSGTYYEPVWAYTEGGRYFQKFLPGDPRFYQHTSADVFATANNVCDPSACIPFVNRILAGGKFGNDERRICRPMAILDRRIVAPLPDSYSSLYSQAQSDLVGDSLHHKGEMIKVRSESGVSVSSRVLFDGYQSLSSIPGIEIDTAGGVLRIRMSENSASIQTDLLTLSTNLLVTANWDGGIVNPAIDGSSWFQVDSHIPAQKRWVARLVDYSTSFSYYLTNPSGAIGNQVSISIASGKVGMFKSETAPIKTFQNTVGDCVSYFLNGGLFPFFGTSSICSSSGFCIRSTQSIATGAPPVGIGIEDSDLPSFSVLTPGFMVVPDPFTNDSFIVVDNDYELSESGELQARRLVRFTGYGWPDVDAWEYTGVLTPRRGRYYSVASTGSGGLPIAQGHPDFTEGQDNLGGEDLLYIGNASAFDGTEIAPLTPYGSPSRYYGSAGRLDNNDILFGAVGNIGNPQYWTDATGGPSGMETNRKRCFANQIFFNVPTDGSDYTHYEGFPNAAGMFRFIRMEMAAEHFNNMAAKVNSIIRVKPLNWIDHGFIAKAGIQDRRFRLRPGRLSGLFDEIMNSGNWFSGLSVENQNKYRTGVSQYRNMRPVGQFCFFRPGDDGVGICESAGIRIRTKLDLPGFALFSTKQSNAKMTGSVASFPVVDSISSAETRVPFTGTTFGVLPETGDPTGGGLYFSGWFTAARKAITHSLAVSDISSALSPVFVETQSVVRADLVSLPEYLWVHEDDVEAYAIANGYRFLREPVLGCRFSLESVEPTITAEAHASGAVLVDEEIRYNWPPATIPDQAVPYESISVLFGSFVIQNVRLVEFVRNPSGGWVADGPLDVLDPDGPCRITPGAICQIAAPPLTYSSPGASRPLDVPIGGQASRSTSYPTPPSAYAVAGSPGTPAFPVSEYPVVSSGSTPTGKCQYYTTTIFGGAWVRVEWLPTTVQYSGPSFRGASIDLRLRFDYGEAVMKSFWPKPTNTNAFHAAKRNPAEFTDGVVCDEPYFNMGSKIEYQWRSLIFDEEFGSRSHLEFKSRSANGPVVVPASVSTVGVRRVHLFADHSIEV